MSSDPQIGVLDVFRTSVESLNSFRAPRVLRNYQWQLLEHGEFSLVSPCSGREVPITRSIMAGRRIAYRVPEARGCWILTGPFGAGHPLEAAYVEGDSGFQRISCESWKSEADSDEYLAKRLSQAQNSPCSESSQAATLLIGHDNFAHHLWNELSAIEEWLDDAAEDSIARTAIIASKQPLGPIVSIFPRLAAARQSEGFSGRPRELIERAKIIVRPGARRVTRKLRQRIREFATRTADPVVTDPIRALLTKGRPAIWISVRQESRTPVNQKEFLLDLVKEVFLNFPDAAILLDGFSYPAGFGKGAIGDIQIAYRDRATSDSNFINQLREEVRERLGNSVASRLCTVSNQGLLEAISAGEWCDYYVCHGGTLQHKVAWVHNIPGLIHLPSNTKGSIKWHAGQVEDGVLPDSLPRELIVGADPPLRGRQVARNFNYLITDTEAAANYICGAIQRALYQFNRKPDLPEIDNIRLASP